jgi:hypothetical protein
MKLRIRIYLVLRRIWRKNYATIKETRPQGEDVPIQFTKMLHKFKEVKDLFVETPEEIASGGRR